VVWTTLFPNAVIVVLDDTLHTVLNSTADKAN